MKFYKSYNFKDKDPVIDQLRTMIDDAQVSYGWIEENSGVKETTLFAWFFGLTRRPQYATVMAVVKCIGYDNNFIKIPKKDNVHPIVNKGKTVPRSIKAIPPIEGKK
jgi:hypothetical protein